MSMALHWGIVSAGKISHDFVSAIHILPPNEHEIVAVGARSATNAEAFAKKHGIPKAYEGYVKIAEDNDIDVVYIGNLNPQHFETTKMMLEHGKHVLCEKPLTMSEEHTRKLVEIARSKKVFLMEGIWSRCFPVYHELKRMLESELIGEVLQVNVSFGFNLMSIDRLTSKDMGGGTILDLGVYILQFQQMVFKSLSPKKVLVDAELNDQGVDVSTNSLWSYPNGKFACLTTSAKAQYPNEAVIIGTKGIIKVPEFWCPTEIITSEGTKKFDLPKSDAKFNFIKSVGLSYEASHVRDCIKSGKIESPNITHEESIQLANHMDLLRKHAGVV